MTELLAWRPYACCYRGDASAPWAVATFPASLRYALRRLRSGRLGKYTWATCLTGSRASRGGCEWPWLLSFLRRHDAGWHDCPAFSCALARTTAQTPRAREVPGVRPTNSSSRVACSLSLFPRPHMHTHMAAHDRIADQHSTSLKGPREVVQVLGA